MMEKICKNCISLSQQCADLREDIVVISKRLNDLISSLSEEKVEVACQTISSLKCATTQTECDHILESVNSSTQTESDLFCRNGEALSHDANASLFDIFMSANHGQLPQNSLNQLHETSSSKLLAEVNNPPHIVTHTILKNQPFSNLSFVDLDREIEYDYSLGNRSVCYFGEFPYAYGNIKHQACPIPSSGNYLSLIVENLSKIVPSFKFNSILITKFNDGKDFIDFHSDNEPEIVQDSDILTISLGETRVLKFRKLPVSNTCSDQAVTSFIRHGDAYVMSRKSQDLFQHSILADNSKCPRISITFRMLKPTVNIQHLPSDHSPFVNIPQSSPNTSTVPAIELNTESTTVYIGDSMLRNLNSNKMSSSTQKAFVLSYPGATTGSILEKLKSDPQFLNINPVNVSKIVLFCGSNNVDNILGIPPPMWSRFAQGYEATVNLLNTSKMQINLLLDFLHTWARNSTINILNLLPRISNIRNNVINLLNNHIHQLCNDNSHLRMITTELHRSLFSYHNGHRKNSFFVSSGGDNVHLNNDGLIRLAKYLKYFVHHM